MQRIFGAKRTNLHEKYDYPDQVAQWMGLADANALARYRRVLLAPATEVV